MYRVWQTGVTDHVLDVEGVDGRTEHVRERVGERGLDRLEVRVRRDEAEAHVEPRERDEVAVHEVHHRLQDAVALAQGEDTMNQERRMQG